MPMSLERLGFRSTKKNLGGIAALLPLVTVISRNAYGRTDATKGRFPRLRDAGAHEPPPPPQPHALTDDWTDAGRGRVRNFCVHVGKSAGKTDLCSG